MLTMHRIIISSAELLRKVIALYPFSTLPGSPKVGFFEKCRNGKYAFTLSVCVYLCTYMYLPLGRATLPMLIALGSSQINNANNLLQYLWLVKTYVSCGFIRVHVHPVQIDTGASVTQVTAAAFWLSRPILELPQVLTKTSWCHSIWGICWCLSLQAANPAGLEASDGV